MSENIEYHGLCSTCKYASGCTHLKHSNKPVFYCEEFEIEKPLPSKSAKKDFSHDKNSHGDIDKGSTKFTGLCVDCDNRKSCTFVKREGGIWHCEEYQ